MNPKEAVDKIVNQRQRRDGSLDQVLVKKRAEFDKMSEPEKYQFIQAGGTLED